MSSVSGLSEPHRAHVRQLVVQGCELMLGHARSVHYSQGADRWEGIEKGLLSWKGQYPKHADCSSTATWLLWVGLHHHYGVRDVVNGQDWRAGYTGTALQHGKRVVHEANVKVGDLAFYGSGWPGEHVAVCLGGGVVFSHGSESGPWKLALRYRPDLMEIRRYI